MAELLKHRYSKAYVERLAAVLVEADPRIDASAFVRAVLGRGWSGLELKQRMRRIADCLHAHVPGDYRAQLATLRRAAPGFGGFEGMFFPDFVERYGLDDFDASIEALAEFTRHSSSEFAVRPFVVRYGDRMLRALARWARHEDEHVRRLASEGSRPRLPWGMRLPQFVADPAPVLAILERLKDDPSEYAVDFVKANGGTSRKVFKIGEPRLDAGATLRIARRHRFRDFTTRRHYPGTHRIAILINGVERAARSVRLAAARR
jgi:3-methyladenine DNA glycosylase AlkC